MSLSHLSVIIFSPAAHRVSVTEDTDVVTKSERERGENVEWNT